MSENETIQFMYVNDTWKKEGDDFIFDRNAFIKNVKLFRLK